MVFVDNVLPIFFLIAVGWVFSWKSKTPLEPLTSFSLYVATPALVFCALLEHPVPGSELGRMFSLMGVYTGVLWAVAELCARCLRLEPGLRRAFALATVPMNVGNYGLPLVRFAFGAEAVPFSVLLFVVFNIPLATWAIWLAAGGGSRGLGALRDILRIPILHAAVAALALGSLGLTLPPPLMKGLSLLGEASIPLLMVILGIQLERTRVTGAPTPLIAATVLRLGISPLLAWWLTRLLGFTGLEQKIVILQTSTPAAVLPLLYALRFDCNAAWLASNLLICTLASGLTISVLLHFLMP